MKPHKSLAAVLLTLAGVALAYLLLWPVPIDPQAWTPPEPPPLAGVYEPNTRLAAVERIGAGVGFAPEGVAIDAEGRIYSGTADGRILRFEADGSQPTVFAQTGGRPLGLEFDRAGTLIVTDANKGLLAVGRDGAVSVLSTQAQEGRPFRCTNDLDVAADGAIYFTDASDKFPLEVYKEDIIEHRPRGRLLIYDPASRTTSVVLDGLYFANGVAVSPDQTFVLVVETGKYRVRRVWLAGERKGQSDIFIDNLPGFPDNITSNGAGKFWLALITPRSRLLDTLLPYPFLRKVILRLPQSFQPAPERYGFVLALDTEGRVVENLQDPSGKSFAQISSALEHRGKLYFGSIGEDALGRLLLPSANN
ncbi:MAG TPA: SMP-30/gluconolactonase/LRE family protein [Pyrinomonadaceae bacterium]